MKTEEDKYKTDYKDLRRRFEFRANGHKKELAELKIKPIITIKRRSLTMEWKVKKENVNFELVEKTVDISDTIGGFLFATRGRDSIKLEVKSMSNLYYMTQEIIAFFNLND